jgi:hypothetical protein
MRRETAIANRRYPYKRGAILAALVIMVTAFVLARHVPHASLRENLCYGHVGVHMEVQRNASWDRSQNPINENIGIQRGF